MTDRSRDALLSEDEQVPSADRRGWAAQLAVEFALKAPSPRNTQPWTFAIHDEGVIFLYSDRARLRALADPDGRELTISCGVALQYLLFALRALGAEHMHQLYPNPRKPELVAKIWVSDRATTPDKTAKALVRTAFSRHTNWAPLLDQPLPEASRERLASLKPAPGVSAHLIAPDQASGVELLIALAHERQQADPEFREELRRWPQGRPADDPDQSSSARWADAAGQLIVLSSESDDKPDWLRTGQLLAQVLLTATDLGLAVRFENQPLQDFAFRLQVMSALELDWVPQQLLRVGYGSGPGQATSRRSFDEVLAAAFEPW